MGLDRDLAAGAGAQLSLQSVQLVVLERVGAGDFGADFAAVVSGGSSARAGGTARSARQSVSATAPRTFRPEAFNSGTPRGPFVARSALDRGSPATATGASGAESLPVPGDGR